MDDVVIIAPDKDFNPRAPCGARPFGSDVMLPDDFEFQPTRPLRGATLFDAVKGGGEVFQPTRPLRGATLWIGLVIRSSSFQPTRPLRGATCSRLSAFSIILNFNPRAPCGARRSLAVRPPTAQLFQPTRPLRGATKNQ